MMSRKDYEKFAQMIADRKQEIKNIEELGVDENITETSRMEIETMGNKIADIFQEDNPRFDRDRFLQACGIKS